MSLGQDHLEIAVIQCRLCGLEMKNMINNSHLKSRHDGMTPAQYKDLGFPLVDEEYRTSRRKKYAEFYNHPDLGVKNDYVLSLEWGIPRKTVERIRKRSGVASASTYVYFQEGFPARSALEAMYDCFLHECNIPHEHEVSLKEWGSNYIADFKVDDCYIEVAGMENFKNYDAKRALKENFYRDKGLKVIWLEPSDVKIIYSRCNKIKVNFKESKTCIECNREVLNLNLNMCCRCYKVFQTRRQGNHTCICRYCGKEFIGAKKTSRTCNKKCRKEVYIKDLLTRLPSDEVELSEEMAVLGPQGLSKKYNIPKHIILECVGRRMDFVQKPLYNYRHLRNVPLCLLIKKYSVVNSQTVERRLIAGWSLEKALTLPRNTTRKLINGHIRYVQLEAYKTVPLTKQEKFLKKVQGATRRVNEVLETGRHRWIDIMTSNEKVIKATIEHFQSLGFSVMIKRGGEVKRKKCYLLLDYPTNDSEVPYPRTDSGRIKKSLH